LHVAKSEAIPLLIDDVNPKQKFGNLVLVTAMTGKAVSLIDVCTLHSVAHLPIKKQHKCALSKGSLGPFQKSLEGVTHVVIDEFTMMSQETLFFLDMRLKEAKGYDRPFGGMHVLLVGDTAQLPPVSGLCLWARPLKSTASETVGASLYSMFDAVYIIKINRQRSIAGRELASFLDGMRTGALSDADHAFINSTSREQVGEAAWMAAASNAVHLYPTNEKVEEENTAKL
jgi:ATP-dependent DNA helicase PIF1